MSVDECYQEGMVNSAYIHQEIFWHFKSPPLELVTVGSSIDYLYTCACSYMNNYTHSTRWLYLSHLEAIKWIAWEQSSRNKGVCLG